MDQEQAAEEIKIIRAVMTQARRSMSRGGGGWIFFLWGCIWAVGYSCAQFLAPKASGWLWAAVDTLGIVGTILILWRHHRRFSAPFERGLGLAWLAVLGHITLLWWLLALDDRQGALLLMLTMALAYILMGLFTNRAVSVAGVVVAAVTAAAYLLLPGFFFLTIGLFGGGTLIVLGLWTLHRWGP